MSSPKKSSTQKPNNGSGRQKTTKVPLKTKVATNVASKAKILSKGTGAKGGGKRHSPKSKGKSASIVKKKSVQSTKKNSNKKGSKSSVKSVQFTTRMNDTIKEQIAKAVAWDPNDKAAQAAGGRSGAMINIANDFTMDVCVTCDSSHSSSDGAPYLLRPMVTMYVTNTNEKKKKSRAGRSVSRKPKSVELPVTKKTSAKATKDKPKSAQKKK